MKLTTDIMSLINKLPVALTVSALTAQAIVNENADFNGRPKTAPVGDRNAIRISSQHVKYGKHSNDVFQPLVEKIEEELARECGEEIKAERDHRSIYWPLDFAKKLIKHRDEMAITNENYKLASDDVCQLIAQATMDMVTRDDISSTDALQKKKKAVESAKVKMDEAKTDANREQAEKKYNDAMKDLADFEQGTEGDEGKGSNILSLGEGEQNVIVALAKQALDRLVATKKDAGVPVTLAAKAVKEQFEKFGKGSFTAAARNGKTVNIYRLLFGNMATTNRLIETRATLCQAHSFSVNAEKGSSLIDTLTASDDKAFEVGKKGASHIAEMEYASYVMFSFASWNVRQAARNIHASCPTFSFKAISVILEAVASWLVHACAYGGKGARESRAPAYGRAHTVVVETTMEQPTTPAAAFFETIPMGADIRLKSEIALANELQRIDDQYGPPAARAALPFDVHGNSPIKKVALPLNIHDLMRWAAGAVVNRQWVSTNGKAVHAGDAE
jgi:hypothetical protein